MSNKGVSSNTTEAWWALLTAILKSMRNRPMAWLLAVWLVGWALFAWHILHPASWDVAWNTLSNAVSPVRGVRPGGSQAGALWLHEVARWGQIALYASTGMLTIYVGYALWVWNRYRHVWLPGVREERFRGGCVLEVIVPTDSKADARAAADMLGQLWNLLTNLSPGGGIGHARGGIRGIGKVEAERLALSLEMWSTPHNDGKVGFYVWCPTPGSWEQPKERQDGKGQGSDRRLIEEMRHLILVHHPRCRVRWVEDPLEQALTELGLAQGASETITQAAGAASASGIALRWYELSLLADSRYPIGSGASDERLLTGGRSGSRPGSPGAGSDPLAAVIGMLGSDGAVPVIGMQIVVSARAEMAGQTQQAVSQELARLREVEAQTGKKNLGPQHEARVLALEEKVDRQGYDVAIRLVAVETVESMATSAIPAASATSASNSSAEARLASLLRVFTQYDRAIAGVNQGFRAARRGLAMLSPSSTPQTRARAALPQPATLSQGELTTVRPASAAAGNHMAGSREWLRQAGRVVGRWPREGVCLPRMLPFMLIGKPCVLNMAELSAIYHFPHQGLEGLPTLRWGTYKQIPPPRYAHVTTAHVAADWRLDMGGVDEDLPPSYAPGEGLISDAARPAGMLSPDTLRVGTYPQDLRRGTYVLGPMGSGKSVFLYNVIVQYMLAGRGVGLIDGKGDSYEEVLRLVPPHLEGEVLTFDPENRRRSGSGGRGAAGRSIGINPLDGRLVSQLGADKVEALTMGLMRKMMGANWEQAVLMQRFMRDGMLAVLEAEPSPTMLNLWRWLQDDGKGGNKYRAARIDRIRNQLVRDFWQTQVLNMTSQQRSSMQNVLTRVDRYIKNDVRHLILQPYSTVNFREIMDRGTIFVGRVSPRLGEDQSFLGALLLNGFLMGAFARQSIPQEERRDYLLVVDEFQNFVDTARADVERMLSMARGYRLGLMLAHQFTEQLPREVLSAILKNAQTWVLFGLQAEDARLFAGYMAGLKPEDFQNLPPYYTYQRTVVGNRQTGVYSARPLPPPLPAENPGLRFPGTVEQAEHVEHLERISAQDMLRAAHVPEEVSKLVRGAAGESAEDRRARILNLAGALYWPAEEGDERAVQALSMLTADDLELYRRARSRVLDRQERERILAQPWLVPDKAARIERLSELRWGTPCVEVEALIRKTLNNSAALTRAVQETGAYGETPGPEEHDGLDIRDNHDGATAGSAQTSPLVRRTRTDA